MQPRASALAKRDHRSAVVREATPAHSERQAGLSCTACSAYVLESGTERSASLPSCSRTLLPPAAIGEFASPASKEIVDTGCPAAHGSSSLP